MSSLYFHMLKTAENRGKIQPVMRDHAKTSVEKTEWTVWTQFSPLNIFQMWANKKTQCLVNFSLYHELENTALAINAGCGVSLISNIQHIQHLYQIYLISNVIAHDNTDTLFLLSEWRNIWMMLSMSCPCLHQISLHGHTTFSFFLLSASWVTDSTFHGR